MRVVEPQLIDELTWNGGCLSCSAPRQAMSTAIPSSARWAPLTLPVGLHLTHTSWRQEGHLEPMGHPAPPARR